MTLPLLLLLSSLLLQVRAQMCTVIPQGASATNYGVFPTNGSTQAFCTNLPATQYVNGALQLSRHQAPPGYLLTLTLTAWATEASYDYGLAYTVSAGTLMATSATCALSSGTSLFAKYAGALIPAPGSWQSNYGAQIGLCFYSDTSSPGGGIVYNISTASCPAGSYCPANSAAPLACAAGAYSAAGAVSCDYTCPAGTFASPPASCLPAPCAAGTYSTAGAPFCAPCPAGPFSKQVGLASAASCQACPAGHNCPPGTSSWASLNCGRGNYCPEGAPAPIPCPAQLPPPPYASWAQHPLKVQGGAFLDENAVCLGQCFWAFDSGSGWFSRC